MEEGRKKIVGRGKIERVKKGGQDQRKERRE